jgi:pSer/pThr/pTyr-binding forkhead associated (FHA) protein
MVMCPQGHDSATDDYCDVCGAPIAEGEAAPAPAPAPAPVAAADPAASPGVCPDCGAPRTGRFCEECGHDFAAPGQPSPSSTPTPTSAPSPTAAPPAPNPIPTPVQPTPPPGPRWTATVRADRAHFERVRAEAGPDADAVEFPEFCPDRVFELADRQVTIGRRSRSRGILPDIDLTGPPEDAGVSHQHAMLVPSPDGWSVVDLGSTNGTLVGDDPQRLPARQPRALADGGEVHLGAWTTIIVRKIT